MWVFENREVRKILGPKGEEVTRENCITISCMVCTPCLILFVVKIMGGACDNKEGEQKYIKVFARED
jgi:hypothetical protein